MPSVSELERELREANVSSKPPERPAEPPPDAPVSVDVGTVEGRVVVRFGRPIDSLTFPSGRDARYFAEQIRKLSHKAK